MAPNPELLNWGMPPPPTWSRELFHSDEVPLRAISTAHSFNQHTQPCFQPTQQTQQAHSTTVTAEIPPKVVDAVNRTSIRLQAIVIRQGKHEKQLANINDRLAALEQQQLSHAEQLAAAASTQLSTHFDKLASSLSAQLAAHHRQVITPISQSVKKWNQQQCNFETDVSAKFDSLECTVGERIERGTENLTAEIAARARKERELTTTDLKNVSNELERVIKHSVGSLSSQQGATAHEHTLAANQATQALKDSINFLGEALGKPQQDCAHQLGLIAASTASLEHFAQVVPRINSLATSHELRGVHYQLAQKLNEAAVARMASTDDLRRQVGELSDVGGPCDILNQGLFALQEQLRCLPDPTPFLFQLETDLADTREQLAALRALGRPLSSDVLRHEFGKLTIALRPLAPAPAPPAPAPTLGPPARKSEREPTPAAFPPTAISTCLASAPDSGSPSGSATLSRTEVDYVSPERAPREQAWSSQPHPRAQLSPDLAEQSQLIDQDSKRVKLSDKTGISLLDNLNSQRESLLIDLVAEKLTPPASTSNHPEAPPIERDQVKKEPVRQGWHSPILTEKPPREKRTHSRGGSARSSARTSSEAGFGTAIPFTPASATPATPPAPCEVRSIPPSSQAATVCSVDEEEAILFRNPPRKRQKMTRATPARTTVNLRSRPLESPRAQRLSTARKQGAPRRTIKQDSGDDDDSDGSVADSKPVAEATLPIVESEEEEDDLEITERE